MTDLSRALSGAADRGRPLLRRTGHVLLRFAVYVLLIDLSFVFLYPFLYMLSTSLKSYDDLHDLMVGWIPTALHWDNYRLAAKAMEDSLACRGAVGGRALRPPSSQRLPAAGMRRGPRLLAKPPGKSAFT